MALNGLLQRWNYVISLLSGQQILRWRRVSGWRGQQEQIVTLLGLALQLLILDSLAAVHASCFTVVKSSILSPTFSHSSSVPVSLLSFCCRSLIICFLVFATASKYSKRRRANPVVISKLRLARHQVKGRKVLSRPNKGGDWVFRFKSCQLATLQKTHYHPSWSWQYLKS